MLTPPGASAKRVLERLDRLYEIGAGEGANRPGLSAEEQRAHELVAGWMRAAGLETAVDPAGNLFGRVPGRRADLAEVWTGSHLDTVPAGGRFDGALGVVAGLEAVERVASSGWPERTLAVVAFRDEEGCRFGGGFFGSRALCGQLEEADLEARDAAGVSVREALAEHALDLRPRGGWLEAPAAYVEAHVEQGPVLEAAGVPLGVVTGIAGMARGEATFQGSAAHAGTTPMDARADALCAAAEFVVALRDAAAGIEGAVATVGRLVVEPGASNVIPGRVSLTVDARAPDRHRLERLIGAIERAGKSNSLLQSRLGLRRHEPIPMSPEPTAALRAELDGRGLPVFELPSGGGHDAGILASAGGPAAMLFVRSARGASHSPDEHSSADDVALCVDVLAGALRRLARSETNLTDV
jgi:allantoate deiminase